MTHQRVAAQKKHRRQNLACLREQFGVLPRRLRHRGVHVRGHTVHVREMNADINEGRAVAKHNRFTPNRTDIILDNDALFFFMFNV